MDIEKATKIIKYKIKKYKEELEIELEDKIDEPRIAYLLQQKSALETVLSELEKKDKIIDLMAKYIGEVDDETFCDEDKYERDIEDNVIGCDEDCQECVKQYFTKKATDNVGE